KSAIVARLTGLHLSDTTKLENWSVLPVGSGRTTLGETQILFEERDDIELEVTPWPEESLLRELRLFAEDCFAEFREKSESSENSEHVSEELYRLFQSWLFPDKATRRE